MRLVRVRNSVNIKLHLLSPLCTHSVNFCYHLSACSLLTSVIASVFTVCYPLLSPLCSHIVNLCDHLCVYSLLTSVITSFHILLTSGITSPLCSQTVNLCYHICVHRLLTSNCHLCVHSLLSSVITSVVTVCLPLCLQSVNFVIASVFTVC